MKDFETVSDYLDAAKTCLGLSTDRALLPVLGITKNYLSELRTGEKFPSPPLMIKIANLALMDAEQALMLLDILTAKTEQERIVRQRIKKKLDLRWYAGAILLLCSPLTFSSDYGLQTTTVLAQSANINCAISGRMGYAR